VVVGVSRPTVKKGSSVVMARYLGDVEIRATDHLVFNYLLMRAYNSIEPGVIHQVSIPEVLEYVGFNRAARLQESIERLCRGQIEIDYIEPNGEERSIYAHFLSGDISHSENGILKFAFDPILVHFLIDPKVYALVHVDRSRDLRQLPALRLYEAMALQFHKRVPVWRVTVPELRDYFQIGDRHARFDNFKANVIDKAVEAVNAIAEFDVLVDYNRGGKGGSVVEIVFTAVSKSHSRLVEARATKSTRAGRSRGETDPHTVDLLDGRTYAERGGPAELLPETIDKARDMTPETKDLSRLIDEWRKAVRGLALNSPDKHFLSWLSMRIAKDDDPLLKDIDSDVFGSLLEDVK